ncbi:MAG: tetratricopeptide repeat protein [Deltaproteobacteria bacterium]|nr:tetratricopeptide repeat protein [Deltaproteobacteria bacterium]
MSENEESNVDENEEMPEEGAEETPEGAEEAAEGEAEASADEGAEASADDAGEPEAAAGPAPARELTDEERGMLAELDEELEKYEGQRRWSDVIRTILAKADIVQDHEEKVALLREAGTMYIERSSNQAEAIKVFEQVLEYAPQDLEAIEKLKEMYEKRRDWESLIAVMDREAQMLDPVDRPIRYVEMADLATKRIRKPDTVIPLWEKVLAVEPSHPEALDALSQLYERAREWEKLATVLETLTDADPDPKMLTKLGSIYADKIGDDAGAVRAFTKLLTINPDDRRAQEQLKRRYVSLKAWDELTEFYGSQDKWSELIRVLEREADGKETDPEERVDLLFRAARLWMEQEGKPDRAARAYEKVLDGDENNLAAAEALSPIYEEAGDARKLARVYEVRLQHPMEPMEHVALLRETGQLYEERLRKPDTAFERYLEAFAVMPAQEIVREDVERMAEATGSWDPVVEAYQKAIADADPADATELRMNLGGVLVKVERIEEAIAAYRAVYEAEPDDRRAVAALAGLYEQTEKFAELLEVTERQMELEDDPETRRTTAYRRAHLYETKLEDAGRAIDAYNEILGEWGFGEVEAFKALDRLYEQEHRWQEFAETLERRIDLGPESTEELAALKFRLGRAFELHLEQKERAVELYREVKMLMPEHAGARGALEGLLIDADVGVSAARILEPIYEMTGEWEPLIRALRVLHDGSDDPQERLDLLTKTAAVYGEQLGDQDKAFDAYAEAFREYPRSEQTLGQLEMIAMSQESFPKLVELLSNLAASISEPDLARSLWLKTAMIQDTQLQDVDGAVAAYRKILDIEPADSEVLLALEELFRRTERWKDLVSVLRRRAEQAHDPEEQENLLVQMAAIHDEFLEDPETAITVYREILELDPGSPRALGALDDLFARQEMWSELADNVDRQLELAADEHTQTALMIRLADLRETRMGAPEAAIEIYREVLLRNPAQPQALEALERLLQVADHQVLIAEILEPIYRDSQAVAKLIGVHEIQAKHASAPERRVELLHQIAELYEVAMDDYPSAFESYSRALAEDPSNELTQQQLERLTPMLGDAEALAKTYEEQVAEVEDPVLAAQLHMKAARIRENQLEDYDAAIAHYRRVLALDEMHLEAATSLERLFQLNERYEELAQIYLKKAQILPSLEEQKQYLYRAATLYEELLERPQDSIKVYHQALELDPEDLPSMDKLIELNLRLEQWEPLLEIYNQKAEIVFDPEEKKRLYSEVGAVFEQELKDNAKAIDSYQRILEIDPDDIAALSRLDRLYQATEAWPDLLSVLEREADLAADPMEVIGFRYRIADLHHHQLDDAMRAVDIYRDILDVQPEHQPTLDALEELIASNTEAVMSASVLEPIYRQLGNWPKLIAVHEVQIRHEEDPLRQVELLHQVAELYEMQLDDAPNAFAAYARALPLDNRHDVTLGSLERLAEYTDKWGEVTALYDTEIQRIREERPEDVIDMALRTAQIYEVHLGDVNSAIDRYRYVVEADEAHVQAIEALDRLFEATERWAELADILQKEVLIAATPDDMLTLQFRLGQVRQTYLNDVDGAISQYQEILAAAPEHSPSVSALELLFAEGVRPLQVGEILEPLYRMQEAWDRLLNVHEVQLNYQPDAYERVSMMHRIAEIAEERAMDHERAFVWMQRALLEDPTHDHTLGEVERLGQMLDGWPQLASTYADAAQGATEPQVRADIGKRLARVYEEEIGDIAKAEEAHRFVLGATPHDEQSLESLDRIYAENGAHEALATVLRRRIEGGDIPADQVDWSFRLGRILADDLQRTDEAIAVYQKVLADLEPEHAESIKALQDIYTRKEDWPNLLAAFEKELDVVFGDSNRADVLAKMARLSSDHLGDTEKAIDLWKQVLDLRGEDPESLNALGKIYADQERWADLVEILEREASIAETDEMRVAVYGDLGRIWYEKLERSRSALDSWENALSIDPANTVALFNIAEIYRAGRQWTELADTLHRIIEVGAATLEDAQLEDVYMQLGHLYNVELEQPVDAVEAYEKALEVNHRNFLAIDAIEHIHRKDNMWEDAIGAMEKRVLAFSDDEKKIEQLLTIAGTWAEQVENRDGGTSAYERILEIDPMHQVAFENLDHLHRAAERWEHLVEQYVVRVESTEDLEESIELLRRVGDIYENKLEDGDQAFDALTVAWSLDYTDKKTAEQLEVTTRHTGKWNELLTMANAALQEEEEEAVKIALCLQCARWYGQELGHPEYAIPYFEQVHAMDPSSVEAMVSMADLYETTQQWDAMAQTLGQIVTVSKDPTVQADTYVRMGKLSATHLGIPEQSKGYYQKALDISPRNLGAIDALDTIYREEQNWRKLVDILQRKVEGSEGDAAKIEALIQLAEVYELRTNQSDEAIATYNQVRAIEEMDMRALKGLERLYAKTERWQDLFQILETQYEVVQTEKERITILTQLAGMLEEEFLKPDQAAARLEQVLEIDPTHVNALIGLARLYRAQQKWDELIDTYERHVSATPDRGERIRIYKALGDTYSADLGDPDRAIDAHLNVLSINEDDAESLDALTRLYEKREDYASALEMMEQLVKQIQEPQQQVDLLFRMGRILEKELGDRISALDKFQMAIDLDPSHVPSLGAMRLIQVDAGDWLAAAKLTEQEASYQENPRLVAELLVELGRIYDERLDEHDRAVETYEAALKQDPDNEDAAMPLVEEYRKAGRHQDAFPLLQMLVKRSGKRESDEQHRLAFELGETAMELGEIEDAIKAYEKAKDIDGTHLPTLLGIARAAFAAEKWGDAFKFYQMLLVHHRDSLAPDEIVDIFFRLGVVKREQGERRKALNMFDKALEEDPHHRPTLDAVIGLYEKQSQWAQVIHFKKQILETLDNDDERYEILDQVGTLWQEKENNTQKAIEAWDEASLLKPEEHRMLHKLLAAYQGTKQWEEAIKIIQQVSDLDGRAKAQSKYIYTIGVITRDELKDPDGALDRFNDSLDLDPDNLKAFEAVNKILNTKKDWKALERAYRKMIHRIIKEDGREDLKFNLFHTLGIIYRDRQRNFEAAAEAFKTASSIKPDAATEHQILAELYSTMPDRVGDAIEEHQWLLRRDPYRVDSYRALYKLYFDARAYDKAWCLAATLNFLGKADNEQQQFHSQYQTQGPIRPRGRVERAAWFNDLMHPDEDRYVSKIMELMAPAVLRVKQASDKALRLDKLKPVDPATSTVTFAKTFGFVQQVLNIPTQPRLYLQQQTPGGLSHIEGSNPPAVIAGSSLLSGYSPMDLMFVIGRFQSYYLSEHFVRTIFKSHTELRMLLLAALRISGMGPADPQVDAWAGQLTQHMDAAQQDGLRAVCRKFIDAGGSTDIKKWMQSVELTGVRAGFLIANDLDVARRMIQALPPEGSVDLPPKDKLKELVLFSVSESYFRLREALGIQIQV